MDSLGYCNLRVGMACALQTGEWYKVNGPTTAVDLEDRCDITVGCRVEGFGKGSGMGRDRHKSRRKRV